MVAGREYCLLVPPVLSGGAGPPPCGEACALPVGGGLAWWGVFVPRWWGSRLVGFLGLAGWGWVWKSVGCRVGWFVGALLGPEGTRVSPVPCWWLPGVFPSLVAGGWWGLSGGWGVWVVSGCCGLVCLPYRFLGLLGSSVLWVRRVSCLGVGGLVGWGFGGGVWAGVRSWFENCIVDASIFVAKLLRAHGGCLGTRSR